MKSATRILCSSLAGSALAAFALLTAFQAQDFSFHGAPPWVKQLKIPTALIRLQVQRGYFTCVVHGVTGRMDRARGTYPLWPAATCSPRPAGTVLVHHARRR